MQYAFMNKESRVNFFTSNMKVSSFETERRKFLGDNEYGTWENPLSLISEELSNTEALRGDNIGALMHHMGQVNPGETKRIITQMGQLSNINRIEEENIKKYRDEKNIDEAFKNLKDFWEEYLSKMHAETPDETFDTMVNIHNPRQCYITKNWSRYLSLYQLGFGARGIGIRDASQDVMSIFGFIPEEAQKMIETLLMMQKRDGSAMHEFNPLTLTGSEGDSKEMKDRPHYYGDDHLWIVLSVCEYIKETGSLDFLKAEIPYYDKDKHDKALESSEVLEHLKRAVDFTINSTGKHGLPLLGFADWNDTVNLPSGAESIFNAELLGCVLKEMIDLMEYLRCSDEASKYKKYYDNMKQRVNEYAWDGEWYLRYFDNEGKPIGSSINSEGRIYANVQSFAVISGYAPEKRARICMDSVKNMLYTENGIKLNWPGYKRYDPKKGGITTYPPGAKENGGIFLQCNPWAIIAETLIKNGNRAYKYYRTINPVLKNEMIDKYECEPYVYAQNILGNEHPEFGAARNSWLSGTASWAYQAAVKYILGIKPCYDGLEINPCIPKEWKGYKAVRVFRNSSYEIEVSNKEGICSGIKEIYADNKKIEGIKIPAYEDKKIHRIKVIMGNK